MVAADRATSERQAPRQSHAHAHTDRFLLGLSGKAILQRLQAQLGALLGLELLDHPGEPGEA